MKKHNIILLGNGFDLAHGLETSYKAFLTDYLSTIVSDINKSEKKTYNDDHWRVQGELINKFRQEVNITVDNILNEEERIANNITIKNAFLLKILNQDNPLWSDLEGVYYRSIRKFASDRSDETTYDVNIENFNNGFEKIKTLLIKYLFKIQEVIRGDFSANGHNPLLDVLTKIIKSNTRYVDNDDNKNYFVNFNYTPTLELYSSLMRDDSSEIINIHGDLNDQENNPIIFGYGDTNQDQYRDIENLEDNRYLKYSKAIEYTNTNNRNSLFDFIDTKQTLYDVKIIGLSCGITDRVLLSQLFEHEQCQSITIYHYKNRANYLQVAANISRMFKDKQDFNKKLVPYDEEHRLPEQPPIE